MASKAITVKEYAMAEGVRTSAIYNRISRGKLIKVIRNGVTLVFYEKDKTIKKPRKKFKTELEYIKEIASEIKGITANEAIDCIKESFKKLNKDT